MIKRIKRTHTFCSRQTNLYARRQTIARCWLLSNRRIQLSCQNRQNNAILALLFVPSNQYKFSCPNINQIVRKGSVNPAQKSLFLEVCSINIFFVLQTRTAYFLH